MISTRRSFLKGMAGILAAGVAPYVITTPGLLMPVRSIVVPTYGKSGGVRWVGLDEREAWLEECRKKIAESMALDAEQMITYGQSMTATEVLMRRDEGFKRLAHMLNAPDRQWFTLKVKE